MGLEGNFSALWRLRKTRLCFSAVSMKWINVGITWNQKAWQSGKSSLTMLTLAADVNVGLRSKWLTQERLFKNFPSSTFWYANLKSFRFAQPENHKEWLKSIKRIALHHLRDGGKNYSSKHINYLPTELRSEVRNAVATTSGDDDANKHEKNLRECPSWGIFHLIKVFIVWSTGNWIAQLHQKFHKHLTTPTKLASSIHFSWNDLDPNMSSTMQSKFRLRQNISSNFWIAIEYRKLLDCQWTFVNLIIATNIENG